MYICYSMDSRVHLSCYQVVSKRLQVTVKFETLLRVEDEIQCLLLFAQFNVCDCV